MMKLSRSCAIGICCALTATGWGSAQAAPPASEVVLHSFSAPPKGANPDAGVVRDRAGNLYGTTFSGGPANYGVVYKVGAAGGETVLHTFAGSPDGAIPSSGITMDAFGNLYGTTAFGGAASEGVVYEISASGGESVLHSFSGLDGSYPSSGIVFDSAGNLYGTTSEGGSGGNGVVYMLSQSGQETVLNNFTGGVDGANPTGLLLDSAGTFFGTTESGGKGNSGVVYKLSSSGEETVLHSFAGGSDGELPQGSLVRDSSGNLYGETYLGGRAESGVIYEVTPHGQETVLYSFPGGAGGYYPEGSLFLDSEGDLYGTTAEGGFTYGLVYELSAAGDETVLLAFPGASDGYSPQSGVILDSQGDLFGTTVTGGTSAVGTVYVVSPSGGDKVLHTFVGGSDGIYPYGGVVRDSAGNLYGTTYAGGSGNEGIVYQLTNAGAETVLYSFSGANDGGNPYSGVTVGSGGNLYGTTYLGGADRAGVVYRVNASGTESVLHTFTGGSDGGYPFAGVTLDAAGNLYGTTVYDGVTQTGAQGSGVVYKVDAGGAQSVLYTFSGAGDGAMPRGGVILDSAGNIYGTASEGGADYGVVYKLDSGGNETVLYAFTGGADGANPYSGLVRDSAGNLYGTTERGGIDNNGVVFEVDPAGIETVLYSFDSADGATPVAGLAIDSSGNLYGTTSAGGKSDSGVVFEIKP